MSGLDARFLFSETDAIHMHTIKVVVMDVSARSEPLTFEDLHDLVEARLDRMPVLRRRVVPTPHGLGHPVLIDDPHFELGRHLHHVEVAPPGGPREVASVVAGIAAVPLPRDRPLWDLTMVSGLSGGQVGFVMKIHHALADGGAAVALLENAFMVNDAEAVIERFHPEPVPANGTLYRAAARQATRAVASLPRLAADTVAGVRAERSARREETTPIAGPFAGPRTPFNVSLGPERTFATLALPLATMTAAKRLAEASLNDVFLALCGGGVRRHLQRTQEVPRTSLVASVPMGTTTSERPLSGNHVDNLFVPLHTEVADPVARLRAVHTATGAARRVRWALGTDLFERRAALIPPALHSLTTRGWAATGLAGRVRPPLNLVASSVAGPRRPLELDGGVVSALYSSGPILEGIGLNITAWTYIDTLYVSLLGCPASLPDPWLLAEDIGAEMAALSAAV